MWKRPWGASEGTCVCCGLIVIGLAMQLAAGGIVWENFARPFNIVLLSAYVVVLILLYLLRRRIYFVRWAMTYKAAVPALAFTAAATLLMGVIRQEPGSANALRWMLTFWPFVILYWWLATVLGLTVINRLRYFSLRRLPSLLNHIGLFVALVCAAAGSADMRRLTMSVRIGSTEWRATDGKGRMHHLPIAIELRDFSVDEYPPKLMVISNINGRALPEERPAQLLLEGRNPEGDLCGWHITVKELLEYAASSASEDTIRYVDWRTAGATNAAYITAVQGNESHEGWVSCGSFLFPYQSLPLDSATSIVMPDREPRKFTSQVVVYTQSGLTRRAEIVVNKPLDIDGWKIYQLNYDRTKGRWSDVSEFELVSDPWLPFVYAGIFLMLAGALCLFVTAGAARTGRAAAVGGGRKEAES